MQAASYSTRATSRRGPERKGSSPASRPAIATASGAASRDGIDEHHASPLGHLRRVQAQRAQRELGELLALLGHAHQLAVEGIAPLVVRAGHEATQRAASLQERDAPVTADVVEGPQGTLPVADDRQWHVLHAWS